MDTAVHQLVLTNAPDLACFAEACFREAFGGHFQPAAMAVLCRAAFALPIMEKLILDGAWVAGDWQGYIALGAIPSPISGLEPPTLELARLYVPCRWQGRGVADRLMGRFLGEVAERGGHSVWLQAYEGSPRALAFYRRWGFADHGPYPIVCEGIALPHRMMGRNL